MHPTLAGKITGMLLEIDNSELLHMLESPESLRSKVCECFLLNTGHVLFLFNTGQIDVDKSYISKTFLSPG